MGQPAYTNAHASFDTEANAKLAERAFLKWINLADEGKLPESEHTKEKDSINGDYGISSVDCDGNEITFMVESPRYQNCVWQCQNVRDFFSEQPGCESIEMDVMTCEDSICWSKEDNAGCDACGTNDREEGSKFCSDCNAEAERRDEKNGLHGEHEDPTN